MPILRDEAFEGYLREEGEGLMFGPYEKTEKLKLFAEHGVPDWFGADPCWMKISTLSLGTGKRQ